MPETLTYESFSTLMLRTSPLGSLNRTVWLESIVAFLAPWVDIGVALMGAEMDCG